MTTGSFEHELELVDADDYGHTADTFFWQIGGILAVLTAVEVSTIWWEDWGIPVAVANTALLVMMAVKFLMVAFYFMHLKWEKRLLSQVFFFGIVLAFVVYMAAMTSLVIFQENSNIVIEDPPPVRDLPPPPTDPPAIPTGGGHSG